jgi:hypothetical protein
MLGAVEPIPEILLGEGQPLQVIEGGLHGSVAATSHDGDTTLALRERGNEQPEPSVTTAARAGRGGLPKEWQF